MGFLWSVEPPYNLRETCYARRDGVPRPAYDPLLSGMNPRAAGMYVCRYMLFYFVHVLYRRAERKYRHGTYGWKLSIHENGGWEGLSLATSHVK